MKKIQTFGLIMAACAVLFTSCGTKDEEKKSYPVQRDGDWTENACGAFCMAYYLAETDQISVSEIEDKAKAFYDEVKFDSSAGMGDYSDPVKIATVIGPYVNKAEMRMNKTPSTDAENLLDVLVPTLGVNSSLIKDVPNFANALGENEYAIEIVVPDSTVNLTDPYDNSLHYVLTYWKDDVLYTLDPAYGEEVPREDFINGPKDEYCFCNGGIFLTQKN